LSVTSYLERKRAKILLRTEARTISINLIQRQVKYCFATLHVLYGRPVDINVYLTSAVQ